MKLATKTRCTSVTSAGRTIESVLGMHSAITQPTSYRTPIFAGPIRTDARVL